MIFKIIIFLILTTSMSYATSTEISNSGTNIGIGTSSVKNALSIKSTFALGDGTYTGVTSPTGGAIIQGNVGVGSTNPGQKLDVVGTIRATDILGVSNTTYTVCSPTANTHWHCDYTAGSTNAQTQINLAITAANALVNGGKVLLTEGNFSIGGNGTSVIPLSNVWLQGSGMYGITTLVSTTGLGNVANVLMGASAISNFRISDLKVDGTAQRANTWNVQQKGINLGLNDSSTHLTMDHLWVYNTPATCLAPDGSSDIFVTDNLFENCGTSAHGGFGSGNNGVGYGNAVTGKVRNLLIENNISLNVVDCAYLVELQSGSTADQNILISNNIAVSGGIGVEDTGTSNAVISGNLITGMSLYGIYVGTTNVAGATMTDIQILNNQIFNGTGDGLDVNVNIPKTMTQVIVSGNDIQNNSLLGIHVVSGFTTISNNIISNNGNDGIFWLSGQNVTGLKIMNNQINSNGAAALAQHQSGINLKINNTFTLTNLDISGNQINSNSAYGLTTELGAGSYTNFSLKNNDFSSNTTAATNLTGSTFTVGTNFFPFGNHGFTTNNMVEGNLNIATNVGIGTLSPGQALDVAGTTSFIRMQSPDGTRYKCAPANGGTWGCA